MSDTANDAGVVLSYLKGIKLAKSKAAWLGEDQQALDAARRLVDRFEVERQHREDDMPVVYRLNEQRVGELRQFGIDNGAWFEVPAGAFERLRMIDPATGNHLIVYQGRKGIKAVANVGHPAAQKLLNQFVKGRR